MDYNNRHFKVMKGNSYEYPSYVGHLSLRHGKSAGCKWRRRPPNMEGRCKYIE